MAAALPEDTWIYILIMAIIILALLWNDKISSSSSRSSPSSSSSSSSRDRSTSSDDTDPTGTGPDTTSTSDDSDTSSGSGRDPVVRVKEVVDGGNRRFKLVAEGISRSEADIAVTGFVRLRHEGTGNTLLNASSPEDSGEMSRGNMHELKAEPPKPFGRYEYVAWTKDSEGRTGKISGSFNMRPVGGEGGGSEDTGDSGPDIHVEYGDGSEDGSTEDTSSDPKGSGGARVALLGIDPSSAASSIDISDISVEIFAQAEPGSQLETLIIELNWPTGSKYENEIDLSGNVVRREEDLSSWLENTTSLAVDGKYGLRVSVVDNSTNKDSDYGTIVINKKSSTSTMPSIEDLHDQQDREIEQFHQGIKDLKKLHEDHKEDIELETDLLNEAKDILQKLNDLEDVEEAIRNHLITDIGETRNLGPRQLKSKSEAELEEMASDAELTAALTEAISSTNFHNSSGTINSPRELSSYVSNLVMEFEDFQDTLNSERQHQSRDNSLLQKLEGEVEEGLSLEKKNANMVQEFLQNAGSSTSAR